jgi:diketogulonate reductase-like aldo/keto reductase
MRTVRFADGREVPAIGQGTWHMGESRRQRDSEVAALRRGLDLGLTLIDTAEMYADGGAEDVVAEAIAGRREAAFVVSKVSPQNASRRGLPAACERSLRRLRIERIDLYLLHWPSGVPLAETVAAFEALRQAGKIASWGVSNFDTDAMTALYAVPGGAGCATNQVLYNLGQRGIEFDLLPWCAARALPVMAYSPVGQGGRLLRAPTLAAVAARYGVTAAQVALAWTVRQPGVIAIPKARDLAHVAQNAAAGGLVLKPADLVTIDAAFPPPPGAEPLGIL